MRFTLRSNKKNWILNLALALAAAGLIVTAATRPKPEPQKVDTVILPNTEQTVDSVMRISMYSHDEGKKIIMDMDDYVVGCIAAEMPASFEMEALKAQAVAIRTLAYKELGQGQGCHGCDVCDESTHCQGYASVEDRKQKWGGEFDKWQKKLEQAAYDTRNVIVTYDNQPIDVFYHASSDGQTEDSINVFSSQRPYLVAVSSPDEGLVTEQKTYTAKSFVGFINAAFKSAKLKENELKDQVIIKARYKSGRVESIKLGGAIVQGVDVRRALGLKSTDFNIEVDGDTVVVYTRGHGHGVGMSQRGANAMAKNGAKYGDILVHYFKGATLSKIN